MEWVETTGKSLEEAKEAALDQLGVDHDDAEFEVMSEPKPGLFGRMRAEARVRARVRPTAPRAKEERRPRRRSGRGEDTATEGATAEQAEKPAKAEPTTRRARTRGEPRRTAADNPDETRGATMDEDVPLRDQAERGREFLVGLLDRFDVDADIEVRDVDEDTIELSIEGDDLGMLIGPKGTTLAALQDLTRTAVQRKTGARNGWLLVDVSGYRQKRKEALERFTQQVADEVRASGDRRALEPMSAADRKTVHDAVNGIEGVTTVSEGEDPRRRVVLLPE